MSGRPLRVVFLSDWLGFPHGMAATNRVRLLARALNGAGARARVVLLQAGERPPIIENTRTRGIHQGVPFEYLAGTTRRHDSFLVRRLIEVRGWTTGLVRLACLARAGEMDVAYLWFTSQRLEVRRLIYLALLRALDVPVMIELNERPWCLRSDRRLWERLFSPLWEVAGAVSISRFLTDWALGEAAKLRVKRTIVEVPILVDVYEQSGPGGGTTEFAAGEPAGERPPTVVFAASPYYVESTRYVIEAMEAVWRRHPDCRLMITGTHPGEPAARWLLEQERNGALDGRVDVAGYLGRHDLLRVYGEAVALLVPLFDDVASRARFPTKIGEYLASSRPIVATAVGEVERFFTDGESAFLCRPGPADLFGERIAAALDDPRRAAEVGRCGRDVALREFQFDVHGQRLLAAFGGVVTGHAEAGR